MGLPAVNTCVSHSDIAKLSGLMLRRCAIWRFTAKAASILSVEVCGNHVAGL